MLCGSLDGKGFWGRICCSVAQSCLILCKPMDCSTPGLPVLHYLPELAQTLVHWVGDAIQPFRPLSSIPVTSCFQSFPASGSFLMSRLFASGGQNIGVSASASVLPMNIQDSFPLGLTDLILLSKEFSRIFSNTTIQKHQFFSAQLSLWVLGTHFSDCFLNSDLDIQFESKFER